MRRCSLLLMVALALAGAGRAVGQTRVAPRLVFQFFGGVAVNQPRLWAIPKQPLLVPGTEADSIPLYDTVSLTRGFDPGLSYGLGVLYYPSRHFGLSGRVSYVGLLTATQCRGVFYHAFATRNDNAILCDNIQGQTRAMGLMQVDVQAIARVGPLRGYSPYLRAGVSAATYEASTVYLEGTGANGTRVIIDEPSQGSLSAGLSLGAGITTALAPGYQFHFDLAYTWLGFPAPNAPADRTAHVSHTTRYARHAVFSFGLDFVLDSDRGRRY